MKIQNSRHIDRTVTTSKFEKANNGNFGKLLNSHIQPSGINLLVKDALSDVNLEIMQEIENITDDENGENIDMETLKDLLNIIKK